MEWATRLLLGLGGVTAIMLSIAILFLPGPFYASYGIEVEGATALLNELKAPALVILTLGAVQVMGVFRKQERQGALGAGLLLYLGFGSARLVALATDGAPPLSLQAVLVFELIVGLLFLLAYVRNRTWPAG